MYFVSVYPVWRSGKRAWLITTRSQDRNLSPGFIIISHRCIKALEQPFTPLAQRKSIQAHNLEVVRSKRTGGTTYRDGAEEARGAHNSEVVGSNPTSGIISIRLVYRIRPSSWTLNAAFVTGVAQRQARAAHNREVTRSKRVAGIYHHIASVHQGTWATLTGVAQRKRAGLITPRS
jgi:hypothetical protein